jgi:hypothetical protein
VVKNQTGLVDKSPMSSAPTYAGLDKKSSLRLDLKQKNEDMFKNIKLNDNNYQTLSQNQNKNNFGSKYESSFKNPPGLVW